MNTELINAGLLGAGAYGAVQAVLFLAVTLWRRRRERLRAPDALDLPATRRELAGQDLALSKRLEELMDHICDLDDGASRAALVRRMDAGRIQALTDRLAEMRQLFATAITAVSRLDGKLDARPAETIPISIGVAHKPTLARTLGAQWPCACRTATRSADVTRTQQFGGRRVLIRRFHCPEHKIKLSDERELTPAEEKAEAEEEETAALIDKKSSAAGEFGWNCVRGHSPFTLYHSDNIGYYTSSLLSRKLS